MGVRKKAASLEEPSDALMEELANIARGEGCKYVITV
jgi:hypothetical protein